MAKDSSFDVVSEVDMQEVDNAVNQTIKEIQQRFDFRGSKSTLSVEGQQIKVIADDDYKLKSVVDILQTKAVKRGLSLKCFSYGKVEDASQGTVRQMIDIKKGIDRDNAKKITAAIKTSKLKIQSQIMEDHVRISGKNKDDLQAAINLLKQLDIDVALQFINYR